MRVLEPGATADCDLGATRVAEPCDARADGIADRDDDCASLGDAISMDVDIANSKRDIACFGKCWDIKQLGAEKLGPAKCGRHAANG